MTLKNEYHIEVYANALNALDLLSGATALSRQKIKDAMQKGCVWIETQNYTQRLRRAKKSLKKGEILHCYYNQEILGMNPPEARLLSDEGSYSIWNKPSGMFSQGSKWGDHCTIYRWAEKHLQPQRPALLVHRLDRAASGLIILAHKKKTAAKFAKMFQEHKIEKHYQVWVKGDFSTVLTVSSASTAATRKPLIITEKIDGKEAESQISLLNVDNDSAGKPLSRLNVEIKTGRKHQIRKHLAGLGFPVIGDRLYGYNDDNGDKERENLQLKAVRLKFCCPETGKEKVFSLEESTSLTRL